MVEMDGMKLVQSKAIMNYIAGKYNLYGKDLKERVMWVWNYEFIREFLAGLLESMQINNVPFSSLSRIDMYAEAARDIMDMMLPLPFTPPETNQNQLEKVQVKA